MDEFVGDFRRIHANTVRYNPPDDEANLPERAVDMCDRVDQLVHRYRKTRALGLVEALVERYSKVCVSPKSVCKTLTFFCRAEENGSDCGGRGQRRRVRRVRRERPSRVLRHLSPRLPLCLHRPRR